MGDSDGETYFSRFVNARTTLLKNVLPQITGVEPNLTDHGPEHVRNVLENVYSLLGEDSDHFSAIELYVLGLGVLFHDVGNLEGRSAHNLRISRYYDFVNSGPNANAQEKSLVVQISQAHTGRTQTGSRNTLAQVAESSHLDGKPVRAREIAAIIRLADELAEGQHRTSLYLRETKAYSAESVPFHDYANATNMCIDRGNGRIAVTYQIEISTDGDIPKTLSDLKTLLNLINRRLAKLNLERRYARFHSPEPLLPFGKISVCMNVQIDGSFIDLGLESTISDEVSLDGPIEQPFKLDQRWDPGHLIDRLQQIIEENIPPKE